MMAQGDARGTSAFVLEESPQAKRAFRPLGGSLWEGVEGPAVDAASEGYAKANAGYWTARAESYSDQHQGELSSWQRDAWAQEFKAHLSYLGSKTGERPRALDVGCGPGFFSIILAQLGCDVCAVDYTPAMLAQARANAGAAGTDLRFFQMDAQALDFPDESFDLVVSRNLTWNLPRPDAAYREWTRVLKPGGLLLNYDANWYAYLGSGEKLRAWEEDRARTAREGVRDRCMLGDPAAMEAIAQEAPATRLARPAWDVQVLEGLGLPVVVDLRISERVWTKEELVSQASTPLFGVYAQKLS